MNQKFSPQHWILFLLVVLTFISVVLVFQQDVAEKKPSETYPITNNTLDKEPLQNLGISKVKPKPHIRSIGQSCTSGEFVTGISAGGNIICGGIDEANLSPSSQEQNCYGNGQVTDGFCRCNEGWTGPYCETQKPPPDPDALPDDDFDNFRAPLDCNDNDDLVYPGAPDIADGKDNDCDGEIDEGY